MPIKCLLINTSISVNANKLKIILMYKTFEYEGKNGLYRDPKLEPNARRNSSMKISGWGGKGREEGERREGQRNRAAEQFLQKA